MKVNTGNKLGILVFVILTILVSTGCGAGSDTDTTNVDTLDYTFSEKGAYVGNMPAIGIINDMDANNSRFTLIANPIGDSMPEQRVSVEVTKDSKIYDLEGNEIAFLELGDYDSVKVFGVVTENEIKCDKLIRKRKYTPLEKKTDYSRTTIRDIPAIINRHLIDELPEPLSEDAWTLYKPAKHESIEGGMIFEMEKDGWTFYLVTNPQTEEKYAVTLTNTDGYKWFGKISHDYLVIESK